MVKTLKPTYLAKSLPGNIEKYKAENNTILQSQNIIYY